MAGDESEQSGSGRRGGSSRRLGHHHDEHHHGLAHTLLHLPDHMPAAGSGKDNEPLVFLGGFVLAMIAGYLNVVLLVAGSVPVTHVTGTVSRLSSDIGSGNGSDIALILPLFACFVLGAAISGMVIGKASLRLGRPYGVAMLLEAGLIAGAAVVIRWHVVPGVLLVATAAGLQNAMASSYGGLIVRTTHLTGIATDLGFLIGRWVRHREVAGWKFALLIILLVSFFFGGIAGHFAWVWMEEASLWVPAVVLAMIGGSYFAWRMVRRAEDGEQDRHMG